MRMKHFSEVSGLPLNSVFIIGQFRISALIGLRLNTAQQLAVGQCLADAIDVFVYRWRHNKLIQQRP